MRERDVPGPAQEALPANTVLSESRIYTLNSSPGWRLKGQPVITIAGREYRSWSPFTSKLSAYLMSGGTLRPLNGTSSVLYLGASYGTTVSHLADILPEATIYCVEVSRGPFIGLQDVARTHRGIVPILEDAFHPERYSAMVSAPEVIIEDVAQKNLLEILLRNIHAFPAVRRFYLSVKARSIDSSSQPGAIYEKTMNELVSSMKCSVSMTDISRFERDHAILSGILTRRV